MIGVADASVNTQWMNGHINIRLTWTPILKYRDKQSGRSFCEYSMDGCASQADIESNIEIQEWSECLRLQIFLHVRIGFHVSHSPTLIRWIFTPKFLDFNIGVHVDIICTTYALRIY